jgi:two-component system phosphate regulon response regulator PhoB
VDRGSRFKFVSYRMHSELLGCSILVVAHDAEIAAAAVLHLARAGFLVRSAGSVVESLALVASDPPDLALVELQGTGADARAPRRLRASAGDPALPVITLGPLGSKAWDALEQGADDCLQVPPDGPELVARVASWIRRASTPRRRRAPGRVRAGPLVLQPAALLATVLGRRVDLTPEETRFLERLLERRGEVLSREELAAAMSDGAIRARSIDMRVMRIRRKLGVAGKWIETIRGFGYRWSRSGPDGAANGSRIRNALVTPE